jgi:hypothetical protein
LTPAPPGQTYAVVSLACDSLSTPSGGTELRTADEVIAWVDHYVLAPEAHATETFGDTFDGLLSAAAVVGPFPRVAAQQDLLGVALLRVKLVRGLVERAHAAHAAHDAPPAPAGDGGDWLLN